MTSTLASAALFLALASPAAAQSILPQDIPPTPNCRDAITGQADPVRCPTNPAIDPGSTSSVPSPTPLPPEAPSLDVPNDPLGRNPGMPLPPPDGTLSPQLPGVSSPSIPSPTIE